MTDFRKVFLDTSPVVYYLECNELYYLNMKKFWKEYGECDYVTSAVTVTEYLAYPYQQNNLKLIRRHKSGRDINSSRQWMLYS